MKQPTFTLLFGKLKRWKEKVFLFAIVYLIGVSYASAQPYQAAAWSGYNSSIQAFPLNGTLMSSYVSAASHTYSGLVKYNDIRCVWGNPNTSTTLNVASAPYLSYTITTTTAIAFDRFVMHGLANTGTQSRLQLRWSVDNFTTSLGEFTANGSNYTLTSVQLGSKGSIPSGVIEFRIYFYSASPNPTYIYNSSTGPYSSLDGTPSSYGYYGPNISIWFTSPAPIPACSGTPTAGTASIASASGYTGSTAQLSLSGSTNASGIAIQWQQASNSGGPYSDIPGAAAASYTTGTFTTPGTTYYRAKVTCISSGQSSYSNAVSYTASVLTGAGNALNFNGTDGYASIGMPLPGGSSYTKEAWVCMYKSTAVPNNILSSQNSPLWIDNGTLRGGNDGATAEVIDPVSFPANTWVHVAITFDAATRTLKLYRNGILVSTATSVNQYASQNNYIGAWFNGTSTESYIGGMIDEVRVWNVVRTAGEIKKGMYGTVPTNAAGLVAYYTMNEVGGTTITNSSSGPDAATTGNGNLIGGVTRASSPVQRANNALFFNGTNSYVKAPANSNYDFATGTIECWVQPNGLSGNACILANRNDPTTRYSFHMSTSAIGFWNNSAYLTVPFTSTPGQWYHLAFVCLPSSVDVYVNGNPIGTIPQGVGSATGLPLYIGYASAGEPFAGAIDEVRIWNVARTQQQIRANMNNTLTGAEANLVGLFSLNQGLPAGTNTGLVTAIDGTANNNHATLNNFALTGSSANWVDQPMVLATLPVELVSFTATKKAGSIELNWSTATEINNDHFEIEKSTDGRSFAKIAAVPARGGSAQRGDYSAEDLAPAQGTNFYRLKQVDKNGKAQYFKVLAVNWGNAEKLSVSLMPQPLHSSMTVKINGDFSKGRFAIYSMNGAEIRSFGVNASAGNAVFQVNRDGLKAGMYFYKLLSTKGELMNAGKIIVE